MQGADSVLDRLRLGARVALSLRRRMGVHEHEPRRRTRRAGDLGAISACDLGVRSRRVISACDLGAISLASPAHLAGPRHPRPRVLMRRLQRRPLRRTRATWRALGRPYLLRYLAVGLGACDRRLECNRRRVPLPHDAVRRDIAEIYLAEISSRCGRDIAEVRPAQAPTRMPRRNLDDEISSRSWVYTSQVRRADLEPIASVRVHECRGRAAQPRCGGGGRGPLIDSMSDAACS